MVTGIGGTHGYYSSAQVNNLLNTRDQLDTLQGQLGTGRKSETYGGLGADRGLALDLRSNLSTIDGYQSTIQQVGIRISVMNDALNRINKVGTEVRDSADMTEYNITSENKSIGQVSATTLMKEVLGLLDTRVDGRYLFGGIDTETQPTLSHDRIMYGFNGEAGLMDVTDERIRADKGVDGLGRLDLNNAGSTVTLSDTATDFGFKVKGTSSGLTNATITGPAGTPSSIDVDFTGAPVAGEEISYTLELPDGSEHTIKLRMTTDSTDIGDGKVQISNDPATMALHLKTELEAQIKNSVLREGEAASRVKASVDFFETANAGEPKRVVGNPPETATSWDSATAAGKPTINWYQGENGATDPRATATARVDNALEVNYGARANETGIARQLAYVAAFSIPEYDADSSMDKDRYSAMASAISGGLSVNSQQQTVETVQSELSLSNKVANDAKTRHQTKENMLKTMSDSIEGVDKEEVAVQVMELQNRMQMTYQATSIMLKLSLVNYM